MFDVVLLTGLLLGYFAISSEVLAYAKGRGAVPRWLRLGLTVTRPDGGVPRLLRGAIGLAFTGVVLIAMALIVLSPSEARSAGAALVLWAEFAAAALWTVFILVRLIGNPRAK